jgi:hypothetical protein
MLLPAKSILSKGAGRMHQQETFAARILIQRGVARLSESTECAELGFFAKG